MDERFYNINKKKKLAEWIMVPSTGSTEYDLGLFYLFGMVNGLLMSFYYSEKNISKLIHHEKYEIKKENQEISFIKKALNTYIDITLSKLVDKRTDAWSFHQLLKATKKYDWADKKEIEDSLKSFTATARLKEIETRRNEQLAHTSKKNNPYVLDAYIKIEGYRNIIKTAVELLDKFVDGEIPYILYLGKATEYNLRKNLYSE